MLLIITKTRFETILNKVLLLNFRFMEFLTLFLKFFELPIILNQEMLP